MGFYIEIIISRGCLCVLGPKVLYYERTFIAASMLP